MRALFFGIGLLGLGFGVGWYVLQGSVKEASPAVIAEQSFSAEEAGFEPEPPPTPEYRIGGGRTYTLAELREWERPAGPPRVGLQVGHLENDDVPEELSGLTRNGAGASAAGYNERDTVAIVTELTAERLRATGVEVDVLPATVPPGYVADAFVSIHADGNLNTSVRGYKIAGPRRDYSGRSEALVAALYDAYGEATALPEDPNISRRMTAYYAFNWPRYEHAVHPYTPSAIVETGFLTNATDRAFLLNQPATAADGITEGILAYLAAEVPPDPLPSSLTAPTLPLSGTVECAPVRAERRDRDDRPCEPALRAADGHHYMLLAEPPLATSTLPYRATVSGEYMPIQVLDNYFWFHWEARGMIRVDSLTREE